MRTAWMGAAQKPLHAQLGAVENLASAGLALPFAGLAIVLATAMLRRSAGDMLPLGIQLVLSTFVAHNMGLFTGLTTANASY